MQATKRFIAPTLALVLLAASGLAAAQTGPTTRGGTGSASSDQEVRRGVPGVDVDVGTRDRGARAGVPGVDVDARNTRRNPGDNDTRRSGAGPDTSAQRPARADRN
jgi:hypothetical protein